MKKLTFIIALCCALVGSTTISAQSANCFDAYLSPFCGGLSQWAANFDGTGFGSGPQAPLGPNYDCLGTMGNPTYFSITIEQSGTIDFILQNTANTDIDFILWGPFSNMVLAQMACDSMGHGGQLGGVVDCSFSGAAAEQVLIPNALIGKVYILMVTNYANTATNIYSSPNTGTGSIACPCEIPYAIDTMPAAFGNQGYLADTSNGVAQFVVCPNQTLGIQIGALGAINDTLSLYGPFSSLSSTFPNNTIFASNPTAPAFYDSLTIFTLLTPNNGHIGVNNFSIGIRNDIYTGGFGDSSCSDIVNIEVVVPGVHLTDQNICSGGSFQISADSIPTTTVGSSNYTWSQISGVPVSFSNNTVRQPIITIPKMNATSTADSILIELDYNYGGLCSIKDTMVLRFRDVSVLLTASLDTICSGQMSSFTAVLSDTMASFDCDDYFVTAIPFAPITGTATSVALLDDELSASLPIGFSFDFYCNSYTNFFISSNGFITFNATSGAGCCSGELIPVATGFGADDVIALAWEDLNPNAGGTIDYFTVGTAPNRQLVVRFNNIPRFGGASNVTGQIVLFEGSNIIDIHTTSITADGPTTQGIENSTGTIAIAVPGRNASVWAAANSSYRFQLNPIPIAYSWTPNLTLSNPTISNPNAFPLGTTIYEVEITESGCTYKDSIQITVNSSTPAPTVLCGVPATPSSSILFEWGQAAGATSWEYSLDSGATWVTAAFQDSSLLTNGLPSGFCVGVWVRAAGLGGTCSVNAATYEECCTFVLRNGVTQNGITLTAMESGPDITYQWIDCNGNTPIIGETGQSFTPTANGNYAVIISDGINTITTACSSVNVLAVNQLQSNLNVVLYPNPTTGLLHLDKNNDTEIAVKITDNVGRMVLTTILKDAKSTIDLKDYPTGIYFISLDNGKNIITQKIVKQ